MSIYLNSWLIAGSRLNPWFLSVLPNHVSAACLTSMTGRVITVGHIQLWGGGPAIDVHVLVRRGGPASDGLFRFSDFPHVGTRRGRDGWVRATESRAATRFTIRPRDFGLGMEWHVYGCAWFHDADSRRRKAVSSRCFSVWTLTFSYF